MCCYHADVPAFNDVDVSHQVLPGQQALHVHKQRLPHVLQPLEVSVQPEEREVEVSLQRVVVCMRYKFSRVFFDSPGNTVHSVPVGGWNQEADRWDRRLVAFIIQHLPLVGLRVIQQSAFIASVDCDLEEDENSSS